MSEIKIYGTLTNATTDKAIVKADQVVGGFMALSTTDRLGLTAALKTEGMIVYDITLSQFYQFTDGNWIEFTAGNSVRSFQSKTLVNYSSLNYITQENATSLDTLTAYIKTIWGLSVVDQELFLLAFENVSSSNRVQVVKTTEYNSNYYLKCTPILTVNNIFLFNSDIPFINYTVSNTTNTFDSFFKQIDKTVYGTTAGTSYEGSAGFQDQQNISTLQGYFTDGIANKATSDSQGNQINTTYATNTEVAKKTVDVHLASDGEKIWLFSDSTETALTYEQVKTLTETETNNVYLTNGYYSFHNKYKYDASISGQGEDAIGFIGSTQLNGKVYSYRIAINASNAVTADEIEVANQSGIPTKTSQLNNDSNFAVDANYVHTDNNYTDAEKDKLADLTKINMFVAFYGSTTYADISAQVTNNYSVLAVYNNVTYSLTSITASQAEFTCVLPVDTMLYSYKLTLTSGNVWSNSSAQVDVTSLFTAVYGTSTYTEITSAIEKGKVIVATDSENVIYQLIDKADSTYTFSIVVDNTQKIISCTESGWTQSSAELFTSDKIIKSTSTDEGNVYSSVKTQELLDLKQDQTDNSLTTTAKTIAGAINELNADKADDSLAEHVANKVTTLDSTVTDIQYPSAKAAYTLANAKVAGVMVDGTELTKDSDGKVNVVISDKQDKTDNSLGTTAKTVVGAINELRNTKQEITDDTLTTTHKTIPTAINELDSDIESVDTRVTTIEGLVPNQATTSNQLADKAYVDDQVGTNSGSFAGTFATLAELQAVENPSNNDYGFVKVTDSTTGLVKQYDRYKYVSSTSTWTFEYTLNNSSFTEAQWEAINSGATATIIDSIADKVDKVEGKQLSTEDFTTAEKAKLAVAVTVDDEELSTTIPINADTLDGYHAQHFEDEITAETTRATAAENTKVDKVTGKQLSTEDYTTEEKTKLAGIAEGATANTGTVTSVSIKVNGETKGTVTTEGEIDLGAVGTITTGEDELETTLPVDADTLQGHAADYFVAKVEGKDLSTNDFTDEDKAKLSAAIIANDEGELESTIPIDADTLEGHEASYFVAAVSDKQLSTEDYTTAEKTKLASLQVITIEESSDGNLILTYEV